jgi:hypothetical protein
LSLNKKKGGALFILLTFVIFGQLDHFGFVPIASPQTAGEPFTITIYAYDVLNNIYPYNGPALIFTTPGPEYGDTIVTFNSGVWQGSFIATLANTYTIRGQDFAVPAHVGESNSIVFDPNLSFKLLSILPGQTFAPGTETGRSGNPTPQAAGSNLDVTVYLTDRWSNLINQASDSFTVQTTDPFAPTLDLQLNNGTTTFLYAFRTAGQHRFFNDDQEPSIKSDTSNALTVYAGEYSRLLVILPGETHLPGDTAKPDYATPGKNGQPSDQEVAEDFPVLVYATDSMWNKTAVSGNQVTLYSDFIFSNPAPEALSSGEAQFTIHFSRVGDNQNLWAVDGATVSYRNYLDIVAAVDSVFFPDSFVVYPNPLIGDGQIMRFVYSLPAACNLVFVLYDPFGNLVHKQDIDPGSAGARSGVNILTWNGRNAKGRKVATGIYYAVLKGWTHTETVFYEKIRVGVVW